MISVDEVADRLAIIRSRIERTGREPESVRIVAVTKKFGVDAVQAALECGLTDVAENYAQEARQKSTELLGAGLRQPTWHFVGQLQRNKVKLLASFVDTYQSVDSVQLVDEIAKRAPGSRILLQVDLADQPGRGGCTWDQIEVIVEHARFSGLDVAGLMGVAPNEAPESARPLLRRLAACARELELIEVSMGMSADLEVAVSEGSTMVRIGSALFGPRPTAQ